MEDRQIIELFKERSEQAISELSKKYGLLCRSVAFGILKDERDAEECANDAFFGVWNTIPPFEPENLQTYVLKLIRNQAIKRYEANTAMKRNSIYDVALDELEDCFPDASSVEDEVEAKEVARAINRFLETLDKQDRIMFIRRYWKAETVESLAAELNRTNHYISVRLSRIRERLKKYLKKEGIFL